MTTPHLRFGSAVAITVTLALTLFSATPAGASSDQYRWDWDNAWLRETNGGFIEEYPFDPGIFYHTLPSRSRSFALHSYNRNRYYQYFHDLPPPQGYEKQPTVRELHDCRQYSFSRPNGIPPYGYKCN